MASKSSYLLHPRHHDHHPDHHHDHHHDHHPDQQEDGHLREREHSVRGR